MEASTESIEASSCPSVTLESLGFTDSSHDRVIKEETVQDVAHQSSSHPSVSIESHMFAALNFDGETNEEPALDGSQDSGARDLWSSLKSVGTSLRGWACIVGSAAAGSVQDAAHEVGRGTSFIASQLSETFSNESPVEQLAHASARARSIGGRVAERAAAAGGELNDALHMFDSSSSPSSSTGSRPRRSVSDTLLTGLAGLREEAQPILHGIKYSPLTAIEAIQGEASTSDHTREKRAIVSTLARDCWALWVEKHEALTRCESLYALLLADSRRTSILATELATVEELIKSRAHSEGEEILSTSSMELDLQQNDEQLHSVTTNRQEALDECRKLVTAQAKEAVDSFKERLRHYPSGRPCPTTMQFRIARSENEILEVLKAFELKVAEEVQEALTTIQEIIVTPRLQTLSESLTRRVDFWEREIEENWSMWTANSCYFHESCEGVADTWSKLQETIYEILVWIADEANSPSSQTSPIAFVVPLLDVKDIRQHKIWEELYSVLIEAATMVVALGAWIDYHNLRGDGVTSQQARDLFEAMLYSLDLAFESRFSYKFDGRDALLDRLTRNASWKLVVENCDSHEECAHWWSPKNWPSRISPKERSFIGKELLSELPTNDKRRNCYEMLFKKCTPEESESSSLNDDRLPVNVHANAESEAESNARPIFLGPCEDLSKHAMTTESKPCATINEEADVVVSASAGCVRY